MNQNSPQNISPKDLNEWLSSDSSRPILVDVRELDELAIASFREKVVHLPLSDFSSWSETYEESLPFDQPIVVICHAGIRSLNFAIWLLERNSGYQVWSLQGGIDAWSKEIDSSIPRY